MNKTNSPLPPPRLAKELQEKNRVIQSLQSQLRGQNPSSHHSSHSELYHSDRTSSSCYSSSATQGGDRGHSKHKAMFIYAYIILDEYLN